MSVIREQLKNLKNEDFKKFSEKIINTNYEIIGVKTEVLKKIAKGNIENFENYFKEKHIYYEEYMIHGFMLGYLKVPLEKLITYIDEYITMIDNWAMVDSIVSNLKIFKKHEAEVFELAKSYIKSNEEFKIRFGYCILLSYYINTMKDSYIDEILTLCNKKHNVYYVQMMVAWLLSFAYIKYREKTLKLLVKNNLDDFTYNKTISKICDSYRIEQDEKQYLKQLRRKYE